MPQSTSSSPPSPPWTSICLLAFGQIISWGSVYYSFTLFLPHWQQNFGWTLSQLTAGLALALISSALFSITVGRAIDRNQGRICMTGGALLAGLLFFILPLITQLWQFYLIWFAFGLVIATTFYEPLFAVLINALKENGRRAVIITTLFGGFAGTIFVPLTYWLLENLTWQQTLIILGVFNLGYNLPVHFLILPKLPHYANKKPHPANNEQDKPVRQAMHQPTYWFLALSLLCMAIPFASVPVFFIHMLAEANIDSRFAILVFSFIGPSQVLGRLIVMLFEKYLSLTITALGSYALLILAFASLLWMKSFPSSLFIFAIALGTANGILTIVRALSVPELLGNKNYGAVQGFLNMTTQMMLAISPFLLSLLITHTGSMGILTPVWIFVVILAFISYGLAGLLSPVRKKH